MSTSPPLSGEKLTGWGLPVPARAKVVWGFRGIKRGVGHLDIPYDRQDWWPAVGEGTLEQHTLKRKLREFMRSEKIIEHLRDGASHLRGDNDAVLMKEWDTSFGRVVAIYSTQSSHGYLYGSVYVTSK